MDFFYDGQIRRYITQFMRIFIGFKYQTGDGTTKAIPVMYGDLSRQVASIIKENSENKMPSVPRAACFVTGLDIDTSRLSDPTFVSKLNIREQRYTSTIDTLGNEVREYTGEQGGGYTIERLMPTPYKLTMKCDIWTSNTDQKLQLLEQILVLFNPSLEVQTTDNYIDWTSLSTVTLTNVAFTNRTIPQGTESDIDICSMDFEMPIYISPPVKVKKLGVVKNIVMNMFNDSGDLKTLSDLVYNSDSPNIGGNSALIVDGKFKVLLLSSQAATGVDTGQYFVSIVEPFEVVTSSIVQIPVKTGAPVDWNVILQRSPGYQPGISQIRFLQPSGFEIVGTFSINEMDPSFIVVDIFGDTVPTNSSDIPYVTSVINPQTFDPIEFWGNRTAIPDETRYLILEDLGNSINQDGPDAWKSSAGVDFIAHANDIIQWSATTHAWSVVFDSQNAEDQIRYLQNLKTKIQYKWDGYQWLKSFEGEYQSGYWRIVLDP
jgi:hypothetical protein